MILKNLWRGVLLIGGLMGIIWESSAHMDSDEYVLKAPSGEHVPYDNKTRGFLVTPETIAPHTVRS